MCSDRGRVCLHVCGRGACTRAREPGNSVCHVCRALYETTAPLARRSDEGESGDLPGASFCPSGLSFPTWTWKSSSPWPHRVLCGGPFWVRPSLPSLALPPAPKTSLHGRTKGGDSWALPRTDPREPRPSEERRGRDTLPGGQDPPSPTVASGAVPGSRPTPACRSSPGGSARTTTGSPASRRGSRCRGRSRPSPRPRPSARSCRGASP